MLRGPVAFPGREERADPKVQADKNCDGEPL